MLGRKVFSLFSILAMLMVTFVPAAWAAGAAPAMPQVDPKMQPYVDALAYWFKASGATDWETRLAQALTPAPDQKNDRTKEELKEADPAVLIPPSPEGERVTLTGVPGNAWWIDVWELDLNGTWVKVPSIQPASQLPGPVTSDLMTQRKLPGVYVIRVCDKSGAVLADAPRLLVVSWTNGGGGTWNQTFDVPSLPKATTEQLSGIQM